MISGLTIAEGKLYYLDRMLETTRLQMVGDLESLQPRVCAASASTCAAPALGSSPAQRLSPGVGPVNGAF